MPIDHHRLRPLLRGLLAAGMAGVFFQTLPADAALVTITDFGETISSDDDSYVITDTSDGFTSIRSIRIPSDGNMESGTVGIEIKGKAWIASEDPDVKALDVDLGSVPDSVGILLSADPKPDPEQPAQSTVSVTGNAQISAATAIKGDQGIMFLSGSDDPSQVRIHGALDMAEGTMSLSAAEVTYAGDGKLGRLDTKVSGQKSTFNVGEGEGGGNALLRIEALNLTHGNVAVQGDAAAASDNQWRLGSALLVGAITDDVEPAYGGTEDKAESSSISVTGNGTLALGTLLERPNERLDASIRESIAGFDDLSESEQVRARLSHILADADVLTNNPRKSTLLTAAGLTSQAVPENVTITVGTVNGTDGSGIYLGDDARWVIYYGEEPAAAKDDSKSSPITVNAGEDSQLIIYGWDGVAALPDLTLLGFSAQNVFSLNGVRTQVVDGALQRLWCWQMPGLETSAIVKHVEEGWTWGESEVRPGYSFIVDSFDADRVGPEAYAAVIDSALYLPASSGAMTAVERVERDVVNGLLSHDHKLFEGKGHWWVQGESASYEAPRLFDVGASRSGFDADAYYGTLGYDLSLTENWVGTLAVSFASIDVQSRGLTSTITSDAASASVLASAARFFDQTAVKLALSYTRAELTNKNQVNGHVLESEPELEIVSGAVRWETRFGNDYFVAPLLQAGVHWASFKEGAITDRTESVHGEGFKTTAAERVWGSFMVGARAGAEFEVKGYQVRPTAALTGTTAVGDRDWTMRTALFDGSAASEAAFESARKFSWRAEGSLEIATSGTKPRMEGGIFGFGAKKTKFVDPYAWSLSVTAAYESASDGEKGTTVGLQFRQLF